MTEYITKDKAKELVCEFCTWVGTSNCEECEHPVDDVPAADVQPVRHGRWIFGTTMHHDWMKCSECLVSQDVNGCFSYCPNCGAIMDKEMDTDGI